MEQRYTRPIETVVMGDTQWIVYIVHIIIQQTIHRQTSWMRDYNSFIRISLTPDVESIYRHTCISYSIPTCPIHTSNHLVLHLQQMCLSFRLPVLTCWEWILMKWLLLSNHPYESKYTYMYTTCLIDIIIIKAGKKLRRFKPLFVCCAFTAKFSLRNVIATPTLILVCMCNCTL